MKYLYFLSIIIFLPSCISGHLTSYVAEDVSHLKSQLIYLGEGQEPHIYVSNNLDRDLSNAILDGYVLIGHTSFETSSKNEFGSTEQRQLKAKASSVKAMMVITTSNYLGKSYNTYSQYVPTSKTTYHSGTVSTDSGANGTYSGTSTTHGGEIVRYESSTNRYSQRAYFFAKKNK